METTGPQSAEIYKDFSHSRVFEGMLDTSWRSGDDAIYRVPGDSLAHVIPKSALVTHEPVNGLDVAEVNRYVAALNRPAKVTWSGSSRVVIEGYVNQGDVISFQENITRAGTLTGEILFKTA